MMKNVSLAASYLSLVDALSAVHQLSEFDLEGITEIELLQKALMSLVKHQDLENCSIFLLQDNQLVCVALAKHTGESRLQPVVLKTDQLGEIRVSVDEGVVGAAFTTASIQHCSDCMSDERFRPFVDSGLFGEVGSFISVPLKSGDAVLGVINVVHSSTDFFEYWHQHFLALFGNCLGRFLNNHRLLHNLERMVTQRTLELEDALTESEDLRQRYQRLSTTDDLTNLHNRRYFFIEGESMLARATRDKAPVSMLLIDIDHFKQINDTWGHTTGDRVLRLIADALRSQARAGDLIARLGGEEFVLLLPNTGPVGADLMAKRVQESIAGLDLGGIMTGYALTASIGMTSMQNYSSDDLTDKLQQLYKMADCAMYSCKSEGRDRRMFYSPNMEQTAS
ncbi:MAG: sensor domain-containing diguanylate cyclase [Gammaproteobacteria bacterium]|nr:sensor domain-containing diguanylate cyclase [Gammaproteobacteria bacterium]